MGNISDGHGEPVPYAHVYVTDSASNIYIGTVSDLNGNFQLQIPTRYSNLNLSISCIGFSQLIIPIRDALHIKQYTLKESERMLSTVVFKDLSARDLIKKAIDNLSENYMQSKFMNQYFSWKGLKMDTTVVDFREQFVSIEETFSDQKGTRTVLSDSMHYSITQRINAEEIYRLSDHLYFDLIKSGATIFNTENFVDWKFTYLHEVDSANKRDVVIKGSRLGRKGFNELTFYLDVETFAFKRVDFFYQWEEPKNLDRQVNDSLYYNINSIEGIFLYEKTAKKYNVKYQFLKVDYSFHYRKPKWNYSNRKFKGVYVDEMNVLCSTEREETIARIPPCNLIATIVNTGAYSLMSSLR